MNRREELTDALIRRLTPGPREYTVRNTVVPSLSVRVHPSGDIGYVHFVAGRRMSLGPATLSTVEEARTDSRVQLSEGVMETLFGDFVSGIWWDSWVHRGKPSTIKWRGGHLDNHLLPEFGGLRLGHITSVMMHRWFDDYSRTAPGNVNHCLHTLRLILNRAVTCGHISSSPARRIKLNPGRKINRFLSREELDRLHEVLDRRDRSAKTRTSQRQQVDIIRLLLLAGCRKNEVVHLRRDEMTGTFLRLRDSKMGSRTVFLNREARAMIERRMTAGTEFLFPSPKAAGRSLCDRLNLRYAVRKVAGLEDVRLQDLRHTYAGHAVMRGTPLPVVSRLLGHSQSSEGTVRSVESNPTVVQRRAPGQSEWGSATAPAQPWCLAAANRPGDSRGPAGPTHPPRSLSAATRIGRRCRNRSCSSETKRTGPDHQVEKQNDIGPTPARIVTRTPYSRTRESSCRCKIQICPSCTRA